MAGDDGMRISPLINSDMKECAFQVMCQQFRRAVGVMIVQGNTKHKLGCLHYVEKSVEEAANASTVHHSTNKCGWYNAHTPNEYETQFQFRNGLFFVLLYGQMRWRTTFLVTLCYV
jgi:hypothetical protein